MKILIFLHRMMMKILKIVKLVWMNSNKKKLIKIYLKFEKIKIKLYIMSEN